MSSILAWRRKERRLFSPTDDERREARCHTCLPRLSIVVDSQYSLAQRIRVVNRGQPPATVGQVARAILDDSYRTNPFVVCCQGLSKFWNCVRAHGSSAIRPSSQSMRLPIERKNGPMPTPLDVPVGYTSITLSRQ